MGAAPFRYETQQHLYAELTDGELAVLRRLLRRTALTLAMLVGRRAQA